MWGGVFLIGFFRFFEPGKKILIAQNEKKLEILLIPY